LRLEAPERFIAEDWIPAFAGMTKFNSITSTMNHFSKEPLIYWSSRAERSGDPESSVLLRHTEVKLPFVIPAKAGIQRFS
jgi:hypothetical protein